jgi:hypothetical protein
VCLAVSCPVSWASPASVQTFIDLHQDS